MANVTPEPYNVSFIGSTWYDASWNHWGTLHNSTGNFSGGTGSYIGSFKAGGNSSWQ